MSKSKTEKASAGRRDFFRKAGLGLGVAGLATTGLAKGSESAEPAAKGSAGYRETEHVKTYYKLARF